MKNKPATLPALTARAAHIRALYADQARRQGSRPWTRSELAQGFVGDVGDLMKLVMASEGLRPAKNLEAALAHELADCLWSVVLLAEAYDVDLEKSFLQTMTALERKLTVPRRTQTAQTSRVRPDSPAPRSRSAPHSGS